MPNTSSAKKYLRQSNTRRLHNRTERSTLRTRIRSFRTLMEGEVTREEADKQLSLVAKALDKAAAKNLIHNNVASRTKSRLAALKKKSLQLAVCPETVAKLVKSFGPTRAPLPKVLTTSATSGDPDSPLASIARDIVGRIESTRWDAGTSVAAEKI